MMNLMNRVMLVLDFLCDAVVFLCFCASVLLC